MTEVVAKGKLTIDEHVNRIRKCLEKTRDSIFETVITIKRCKEDLGDEVFQKEIANRLGMSPSTLNRWMSIGNSDFVLSNRTSLPSTFSSLYDITQLEKKYVEFYGESKGVENLQQLVERGKIGISSYQSDIQEILRSIDLKIKNRKKGNRENKIVELVGGSVEDRTETTTLRNLLAKNAKFRSFVVRPPNEIINRWGNDGISELDIIEEFPLHELRTPSQTEAVTCLVIVSVAKVDVGIKILTSFGFTYRDMFVPPQNWDQLTLLKKELVILRGERGLSAPRGQHILSSSTEDVTDWVVDNCNGPYCLVFDTTKKKNWVNVTNVA